MEGINLYRIEKTFKFPMGHRLSKHKGACFNIHGHNYVVKVGLKSPLLNPNGMVIDFSALKRNLKPIFDTMDHACMVNKSDSDTMEKLQNLGFKVLVSDFEPTAEVMSHQLYNVLNIQLENLRIEAENPALEIEYVTIYEDDGSSATYKKEEDIANIFQNILHDEKSKVKFLDKSE